MGRIVKEVKSDESPFTAMEVDVPIYSINTVYSHFGDTLAWACLLMALVGIGLGIRRGAVVAP